MTFRSTFFYTIHFISSLSFKTAMTAAIPDHIRQMTMMAIPMGVAGQPEDIAETAVFLSSTRAKYITGAAIDVNGGLL